MFAIISGFNPSQVQFTLRKFIVLLMVQLCFNPSQVQFTYSENLKIGASSNVSIPHRFNSHRSGDESAFIDFIVSIPHRFNSHGGWKSRYKSGNSVSIPHRFNSQYHS